MSLIRAIKVCQPIGADSPSDWRTTLGQILVCIETNDGLTGYGIGGGGKAGMHVIDAVLKKLLLRQPIEPVEEHWDRLTKAVLPFGPEGIAMMALSGVDLALWDLRAKEQQTTVAQLLNPDIDLAAKIPTYQTVWGSVPPELSEVNCGVKLHLGTTKSQSAATESFVDSLVEKVAAARDVIGEDRQLMVDAWMTWDVATTLAFAEKTDRYRLTWIEEPLPLTDHAGYRILARECPTLIAGGEHIFTAQNFDSIIENHLHTILQPDACWVGGMTEMVKIYHQANQSGLKVVPHRGAEVWGLHALAALGDQPLAESGRPWIDWTRGQPVIINGMITLSEAPGFGIEIDPVLFSMPSTMHL